MRVDKLSIAHFSDLHRNKDNPISNVALLDSLMLDMDTYTSQRLAEKPDILIVSGDIIQGSTDPNSAASSINEQYNEALSFLNNLTAKFLNGDKSRLILIPGNHDISWTESKQSMVKIEDSKVMDSRGKLRKSIFKQAIKIDSNIRWSWPDRSFYRITNRDTYNNRFSYFCDFYQRFYDGTRSYNIDPDEQFEIFNFEELGITIVGLNSCFCNDHLNKAGFVNPQCIGKIGLKLRKLRTQGRLLVAVWHHSTKGGPYDQDYMDNIFVKSLIAHNFKIGFHGHQHKQEIVREEKNIIDGKSMLVISAGSLCAGPTELPAGYNQQYNLLELQRINNEEIQLILRSRLKTQESSFDNPVWDQGTIGSSIKLEFKTNINHPKPPIPDLGKAEKFIGGKEYVLAVDILKQHDLEDDIVRKLLLECYMNLEDHKAILTDYFDPRTNEEAIALMDACMVVANRETIEIVLNINLIKNSKDPALIHVRNQLKSKLK